MSQTQAEARAFITSKFPDSFQLNKTDTAKVIGPVSTATLDRLTKDGAIVSKKVGGQVFYKIDEIAIYLAGE